MMKTYDIEKKKEIENSLYEKGYKFIGGADEVGRGPLAGPVVCAAVILPKDCDIEGIDDSKKLSPKKREELYDKIIDKALAYDIQFVFEDVIDEINILEATKLCMARAINSLKIKPDIMLIDALKLNGISCEQKAVVHGDALCYCIGAASIIAKVARDRFMDEQDKIYPEYGFKYNKGYGTKAHMDKLKEIGPCKIHRHSFLSFLDKEVS